MMTCHKAKELLSEYLDGSLKPEVKNEINEFLKKDNECSQLFKQAQLIKDQISSFASVKPSEGFDSNLREKIIQSNSDVGKRTFFKTKGFSIAFSGALIVATLYVFTFTDFESQEPGLDKVAPASESINTQPSYEIVNKEKDEGDTTPDSLKKEPEEVDNSRIKLTGDK